MKRLFFFLAIAAWSWGTQAAEVSRLAVISDNGGDNLAALLTGKLSALPGIALVERDELAKIGNEQIVREMATRDPANLGRLLHADGLLFVRKEEPGLAARFTAVRLGLVLFDVAFDPKAELPQIADLLAGRVGNLAPKLLLPPEQAIPISLLNLHADIGETRAIRIEQALTLLLERRLAATPELVVLERRHAGSLALERSLSADLPQPQAGAWWIDGALNLPAGADPMTVRLRMRSPKGGAAVEAAVSGSSDRLPELADALAVAISKSVHASVPAPDDPAASTKEAREFLLEAIWAWHHGKLGEATEALDSAELLGEKASDAAALRISIALQKLRKDGKLATDEQIDVVLPALLELRAYADDKGESRLQLFDAGKIGEGRASFLAEAFQQTSVRLLHTLVVEKNPREQEVRRAVRTFIGYAPLEGKIPNTWPIAQQAEDLAESTDEEAAYYRAFCNPKLQPHAYWSRGVYVVQQIVPDRFCARFLATPEERSAAFFKMLDDLADDPVTRPVGLFLRAMKKISPTRQDDYQALLIAVWDHRQSWQDSGELWTWIKLAFSDETKFPPPADPKLIALLRFYLQHETKWGDGPQKVWHPEYFSKEDAPLLWTDLEGCKERCLATGGSYFTELENKYIEIFGNPDVPSPSSILSVHHFWHPDPDKSVATFSSLVEASDGIWAVRGTAKETLIYRIRTGDMSADAPLSIPDFYTTGFLATPTALYLAGGSRTGQPASLHRYDLLAGTWEARDVDGISKLFEVGGQLYFYFWSPNEAALGRYDWATGQKTILASNHRVPPQNSFETKADFRVMGVFPGPGGKPCALVDLIPYVIQEEPGEWKKISPFRVLYADDGVQTFAGKTLLAGLTNSDKMTAILIDSDKAEPEAWLGPPQTPAPDAPPKWTASLRGRYTFAAHGDNLIAFVAQREGGSHYSLLCFVKGKETPIRIPIRFDLDDATKALLPQLCSNWAELMTNPETSNWPVTMIPTSQGLCFRPIAGGFWFLPFSEIDAYLASSTSH